MLVTIVTLNSDKQFSAAMNGQPRYQTRPLQSPQAARATTATSSHQRSANAEPRSPERYAPPKRAETPKHPQADTSTPPTTKKEEGPTYATAEVGARNRTDPRYVQDARSSSKGAKRHRKKGGTRRERGTREKQGDMVEVGVLTEEQFS